MDPDLDDTNNQFPTVTPDGDGDDLDEVWVSPIPGLPHIIADKGLPPKRVAGKPYVNDYTPESVKYGHQVHSLLESEIRAREEGGKYQEKAKNPPAVSEESTTEKSAAAGNIGFPSSQVVKRTLLNEIGDVGTQRAAKIYPTLTAIRNSAKPLTLFSRKQKGEWEGERPRGSLLWILYTGVGVIALLMLALYLNRSDTVKSKREQSPFSQLVPDAAVLDSREDVSEIMTMLQEGKKEAERIYAIYATAKSTTDFIGSVRHAEEIAGLLEQEWKPLGVKPGWQPDELAAWTILDQDDLHYSALEGILPDLTPYRAFFLKDDEGLKMDWKATVGYCSADFDKLNKGQGDSSEVRAFISPQKFYTFPFPEGEFRSFQLASPDRQERLWGYVKIGGELERDLISEFIPSQITGEAKTEATLTVALERGPKESLPNQWIIAKLLRLNWLDK